MRKHEIEVGQKFGRWEVVSQAPKRGHEYAWTCVCECGTERSVRSSNLVSGISQSCGCLQRERTGNASRKLIDGVRSSDHPYYLTWKGMKTRCLNPNVPHFKHYGGKGVSVCQRWQDSFADFVSDMGPRPNKYTLERRDSMGDYCPENCYWASRKAQARNRSNNRMIEFRGETLQLCVWAERMGISQGNIKNRIKCGWPIEKILTTPLHATRRDKRVKTRSSRS